VSPRGRLDPLGILAELEAHRVSYVVVGELAGVLHGTGGVADDVEIVPSLKPENLERLDAALKELAARPAELRPARLGPGESTASTTRAGRVVITAEPTGTRGYDDLRRAAAREPIGSGVRPSVASLGDLIRIADASLDPRVQARAETLRRVAELGLELVIEL
jgi:hypothetical protein